MTAGFFDADLRFEDDFNGGLHEVLVTAGLARDFGNLTLGLQLGAMVDGTLTTQGTTYDLAPGFLGGLGLTWRAFEAPRDPLSLTFGLQLAVSTSALRDAARSDDRRSQWVALDARVSVMASRTFADVLTPYVAARAFGGPVFWSNRRGAQGPSDVLGTDRAHVQFGLGLGVTPHPALSLHIEWDFFGERGVFGGIGTSF